MSEDNGMDVSPSWEQLKAERDEYERQYLMEQEQRQTMQHEVNRIEAERNALAAHVEAGSRLATIHDYWRWRERAPDTSLARLKAEFRADGMDEIADLAKRSGAEGLSRSIRAMAAACRQAEDKS